MKDPKKIVIIILVLVVLYFVYKQFKGKIKSFIDPNGEAPKEGFNYDAGIIPFIAPTIPYRPYTETRQPDLTTIGMPFNTEYMARQTTGDNLINGGGVTSSIYPAINQLPSDYGFNSFDATAPRSQNVSLMARQEKIVIAPFNSNGGVIKDF